MLTQMYDEGNLSGKKKAHKHKLFGPVALGTQSGFVPGTNRVCPRDKVGLSQGQTQVFSLLYTVEAQFCPWDKPGLSLGHFGDEGRQKEFMC